MTVWASTQGISSVREDLASHLGIPINKVRCICDHMGGGFGSKFGAGVEGGVAARLARDAGAPVKMLLDRKAEFLAVGNRPSTVQKLKLAADKDGKLTRVPLRRLRHRRPERRRPERGRRRRRGVARAVHLPRAEFLDGHRARAHQHRRGPGVPRAAASAGAASAWRASWTCSRTSWASTRWNSG